MMNRLEFNSRMELVDKREYIRILKGVDETHHGFSKNFHFLLANNCGLLIIGDKVTFKIENFLSIFDQCNELFVLQTNLRSLNLSTL